jgi:hypothetical protein
MKAFHLLLLSCLLFLPSCSFIIDSFSLLIQFSLLITAIGIGIASIISTNKISKDTLDQAARNHADTLQNQIEFNRKSVRPILVTELKIHTDKNLQESTLILVLENAGIGSALFNRIEYSYNDTRDEKLENILNDYFNFANKPIDSDKTEFKLIYSEHALKVGGSIELFKIVFTGDKNKKEGGNLKDSLENCYINIPYKNIYDENMEELNVTISHEI